jgi:hypothetical protein
MNPEEHLVSLSELVESKCQLNHKHDPRGIPDSTNAIIIPIGYHKSDIEDVATRENMIPVCAECAESLTNGDHWVLVYCLNCCESNWII